MLIRFFAYFYPPCIGGGEVILQHQAEELARRGHQIHVHCTAYRDIACSSEAPAGDSVEGGVHVHRARSALLPFHNPLEKDAVTPGLIAACCLPADLQVCVGFPSLHLDALDARRRVRRRLGRPSPPLIVQNYITADFLSEILDARSPGARSPDSRSSNKPSINKRLRAAYWRRHVQGQLARADLVIADSPAAGAALSSRLSLNNVATHIGMAVDPAEFDAVTPAQIAEARAAMGLSADPAARYLLAPSRISRQKGVDLLLEAAAPLLREDPCLQVAICGPVNEPEFAAGVRAQAAKIGAQAKIGELPRPLFVALMRGAAAICLPSRGETVGGVAFEAMYAGVPAVVSAAVEAAREDYLRDGSCGWLVPPEDPAALRAALAEILADGPGVHLRVGAARAMVERRFTWGASVDRLIERWRAAGIAVDP